MTLPQFARRTEHIKPFLVMEVSKKAAALEQAGHPVISLLIGEPDFTATEPVLQALDRAAKAGRTQYSDSSGILPLREAIAADYERRHGLKIDVDRILITAGASGALTLACAAMVNPGDGILMADPGYPCNRNFVAAFNGEPQSVATTPASRFQLTQALVDAHWRENTRGVLVSTPSNPTGTSMPTATLATIIDGVRRRGGFSIVDEIYLGLCYDDEPNSALALADDIIVVNSFSKTFSMTGWRLGWMVVPEGTRQVFDKISANLTICPSVLAQQAAIACFEPESLAIYEQRRQAFKARRDWLVPALEGVGLSVPAQPDGAFYVYADISKHSDNSFQFAHDLLEKAFVGVVPGMDFGINQPERYVRISYANSMENLEEAVSRIGNYLAER